MNENYMEDRRKALCKYRLEKAKCCLASADVLFKTGDYCSAVNRSYYAIFHSIRSLLALDAVDFSKHSGVMSYFQKNYIKTGKFEKKYSNYLTEAFEIRSESDYDDYCVISSEEAQEQIRNASFFVCGIETFIKQKTI